MGDQLEIEDFDTAKAVFEKLKEIPAERRKRILSWVAEGLGVVLQAAAPTPAALAPIAPTPTPAPPLQPASTTDIKSFVAAKAPKSDVQFAATVAYYYRFEAPPSSRKAVVDGETVQEGARLAGRTRLGNPTQTLRNAKNLGYLDSNSPGEFSINSVGENLVAMTLPGAADGGAKSKKTKKSNRKG